MAELEFVLTPVSSNWPLHLPQDQALAFKGSSIDHGLSADTKEASAVLQEDSCPQAILKLRPPNSLDYRARYRPQPIEKGQKFIIYMKPVDEWLGTIHILRNQEGWVGEVGQMITQ